MFKEDKIRTNSVGKMVTAIFFIIIVIYLFLLIAPVFSIIKYSGLMSILNTFNYSDNIYCIMLSLATSLIALILTFLLGTPTAFYLAEASNRPFGKLIDIIVELPIVLPPAVVGIGLLLTFGERGIIGSILSNFGISIVFTPAAVVIAQFFVSSAFYVKILKNSIKDVPKEIFEATYVLGASKATTAFKIIIPMVKKSIISGLILSWIRSLGEFGATLMFAGNVLYKTRTVPLQIYTYMNTDIRMATAFAAVLYILSFTLLLLVRVGFSEE
ncbi:MAG: ABC transporter permease [Bacillota bacterium]|nr:ABC transporter permease [Bacillota bacterium]